jgi:hypothetical protein
MQSLLSRESTNNGQAPAAKAVTGQYLAKATVNYPRWRRAEDAVRWQRREVDVKPTAKLAAEVFGTSLHLMKTARARLERHEQGKRHRANGGNGTTALSDDAVERIVVEIGPERILRVVDKLTSPEPPLVAAE